MPAGLIEDKIAWAPAVLLQRSHRDEADSFGVAEGQNEGSTGSVFGANRTEQIGRLGALIMSGSGTRALPGPTIGKLVLLADPHLVLT